MKSTVQMRMYEKLSDLVPMLVDQPEGATFYAAPLQQDDMSSYCNVNKRSDQYIELEIAHDMAVRNEPGETTPAPWMVFRLNVADKTAELIAFQDGANYEIVQTKGTSQNRRSVGLNMFAVNWLNIMINLQSVFVPFRQAELSSQSN